MENSSSKYLSEEDIRHLREILERFIEDIKNAIDRIISIWRNAFKIAESEETDRLIKSIENRKKLRRSWRHDSCKSKLSPMLSDKRRMCHNCRNNC